jgi:uroporphyrinogen-III decarboxylase
LDAYNVLEMGSEGMLEFEIKRQMNAAKKNAGRFIMSIGSPVTPDTPVSRVRLYCDMVRRNGRI